MKRFLLALCGVAVLAAPAAALARTAVSGADKAPLIHAALGSAVPRQCASVYISSVDRAWAAVFFKPARGWSARCKGGHHAAWTALHHTQGRWRVNQSGDSDACVAVHVPVAVRKDLRITCYPLLP
jgi:hypothetical protein